MSTELETRRALERAANFLVRKQQASGGYWTDFSAWGVPSDEWVTAYAACALAEVHTPISRNSAARAWNWLTSHQQSRGAGLGYNVGAAADSDSSLWGCRLAVLINRSHEEWVTHALSATRRSAREDGGVATFASADSIGIGLQSEAEAAGWTVSHVCVSAAAAWLDEVHAWGDVVKFLCRAQQPEGFWYGYWWADREYATAHALESMARHDPNQFSIAQGAAWLAAQPATASPFRLALRVLGITRAGDNGFGASFRALLEQQLDDGSWPASARLRISPTYLRDPEMRWNWDESGDGFGSIVLDRERIFTTATAVRALCASLNR